MIIHSAQRFLFPLTRRNATDGSGAFQNRLNTKDEEGRRRKTKWCDYTFLLLPYYIRTHLFDPLDRACAWRFTSYYYSMNSKPRPWCSARLPCVVTLFLKKNKNYIKSFFFGQRSSQADFQRNVVSNGPWAWSAKSKSGHESKQRLLLKKYILFFAWWLKVFIVVGSQKKIGANPLEYLWREREQKLKT